MYRNLAKQVLELQESGGINIFGTEKNLSLDTKSTKFLYSQSALPQNAMS